MLVCGGIPILNAACTQAAQAPLARWELIPDRLLSADNADKNLPANSGNRQHVAMDLPDFDG